MIKKLIVNISIVAAVVFVLDFAIGRTLRYFYFKESSGLHYRTTYSMEKTTAEILIFGSSRANHHYVPEIFEDSLGKTFYNTGRDGNGIFYQVALLKCILKRYIPEIIILDYKGDFGESREEYDQIASLLPYYRTHKEIREVIELRSPYERIKLFSEIYPFNSQALTIGVGNMDVNKKRNPDNKGYVALETEWPPEMQEFTATEDYPVDPNKVDAFRNFIVMARNAGVKVYVVYSPLYQKLARNMEVEICRRICNEEKVPFFDYSKDTFFLKRGDLFYDDVHLNHDGASILSGLIARKIKNGSKS